MRIRNLRTRNVKPAWSQIRNFEILNWTVKFVISKFRLEIRLRPISKFVPPSQTIFQANNGRGLPTRTFKDKLTLFKGSDEVNVYFFGRGNTNGDTWVLFPSLRMVSAGDVFSGKNIPLFDANNGGSAVAMADSLQKAYDTFKNKADMIITGHSTLMTMNDLKEYVDFNREFVNDVKAAKKAGKSIDEVATTWKIPAKYAGYAAPDPARLKNNVRLAYAELEGAVK